MKIFIGFHLVFLFVKEYICRMKRLTNEQFIEKARSVHGGKYDYTQVNYQTAKVEVNIVCPIHGVFPQTPTHHLAGCGCPDCGGTKQSTTEVFVQQAKKVHNNKYDYTKTLYTKAKHEIVVTCPIHGDFTIRAYKHLQGQGCGFCAGNKKKNIESFIEKATIVHKGKYTYENAEYINNHSTLQVTCPSHGDFPVTPYSHIYLLSGCPVCAGNKKKTTEQFIQEAREVFGNRYIYDKTYYGGAFDSVTITCRLHGDFEIPSKKHLKGAGCQKCHSSKLEQEIRTFLQKNYKGLVFEQFSPSWLKPQYLDFYLPRLNVAIECQGIQHFEPRELFGGEEAFERTVELDKNKAKLCKENHIRLLYYSNLKRECPYEVFEDKNKLLQEITKV